MAQERSIQEMESKREQFVELAKEVYPLMKQIGECMKAHGFTDSARATISSDGYMEFAPYDTGWILTRYSTEETPMAQYEYREKIYLEEEK